MKNRTSLVLMMVASFFITYYLSMTLLLRANTTDNLNKIYQSFLMAFWMGLVMALLDADWILVPVLGLGVLGFSLAVRYQLAVGQQQFAESMIEHHGMALDMTKLALPKLTDPTLQQIAANILRSQQEEIELMRTVLRSKNRI